MYTELFFPDFSVLCGPNQLRAGACAIDFQTESVLAPNKNLKFPIHFHFFLFSAKTLSVLRSIAHDPALNNTQTDIPIKKF